MSRRSSKPRDPGCPVVPVDRRPDSHKGCSVALLDNSQEYMVIVRERESQKLGIPKGHFKGRRIRGEKKLQPVETNRQCIHRETLEEVGIVIEDHPHIFISEGPNQIVVFAQPWNEIRLCPDYDEIEIAWWLPLRELYKKYDENHMQFNLATRKMISRLRKLGYAAEKRPEIPKVSGPRQAQRRGSRKRSGRRAQRRASGSRSGYYRRRMSKKDTELVNPDLRGTCNIEDCS